MVDDPTNFRAVFRLRRDQVDRVEHAIQRDLERKAAVRDENEAALRARLTFLGRQLPWTSSPGGQVVDHRQRRKVARIRERMLDEVDRAGERIERGLLPKRMRA